MTCEGDIEGCPLPGPLCREPVIERRSDPRTNNTRKLILCYQLTRGINQLLSGCVTRFWCPDDSAAAAAVVAAA